jgi:hypothetical protein
MKNDMLTNNLTGATFSQAQVDYNLRVFVIDYTPWFEFGYFSCLQKQIWVEMLLWLLHKGYTRDGRSEVELV